MEQQLVKDILSGNETAFCTLIEQYQRLVFHIIQRMTKNAAVREDLAQDIFLKVYQSLENFRFESKLSTWIGRIAYNTCVNWYKKKKVLLWDDFVEEESDFENLIGHDDSPEKLMMLSNRTEILENLIRQLPPLYGTILTLYHKENLKYNEISEIMDLPEGTVKNYLFRARKHLKNKLVEKYQPEEI